MEYDTIVLGDCLELLADTDLFADDMFDCVITSPPYFQQRGYNGVGMGNEDDLQAYLTQLLKVFEHCLRVTKSTGSIVFNLGDKYNSGSLMLAPYRFAIAVLDQFKSVRLINDVTWVKSNPTPRQDQTKLTTATEPFFIFAKSKNYIFNKSAFQPTDRPTAKNVGDNFGRGYHIQIDEAKDLSDEEKRCAHIDLDAAIKDVKDEIITGLRMKIRGVHALAYGGQDGGRNRQIANRGYTIIRLHDEPMKRDIVECNVETIKGNQHPAVYPVDLIEEFVRLLTPVGGLLLDPFSGSGSTAMAAKRLGRHFIGIEIDPTYHKYSLARVNDLIGFTSKF